MKIDYFMADPAGNITAFVTTPLPQSQYLAIAKHFFTLVQLGTEQVAFLSAPRYGGQLRCEMSGGEFCGNAARSSGFYYAQQQGSRATRTVLVEMSGAGLLTVEVDLAAGSAYCQMPLPRGSSSIDCCGQLRDVVLFDGIAHIIIPDSEAEMELVNADLCRSLCQQLGQPALGLMFLDLYSLRLRPVVWVDELHSLVWENSCGSGSAACACWLSQAADDGQYSYSLPQPGGMLQVRLQRQAGAAVSISMGGPVKLGQPHSLQLSL